MRMYVDDLQPMLRITLCDEEPLDLTDASNTITVRAFNGFYYDNMLWTADIAPGDRTFVDECTQIEREWNAGETTLLSSLPGYSRMMFEIVIKIPPDNDPQTIRPLRAVKVRA